MAKSNSISPARVAAFEVLERVENGAFSSAALAAKEPELSSLDRALCHELVLGVLRWQLQLDTLLEHFSGRKIGSLDAPVRRALRLGIYQLRFLARIPASAAVNDSVNLVARSRLSSARPFVNAVLRRAAREQDYSPLADIHDAIERITIETSHPRWLIDRWCKAFGVEETRLLAQANNQTPPIAIRVVNSVARENDVVEELKSAGAEIFRSDVARQGWIVSGATSTLRRMSDAGEIYLQDQASQIVGDVVSSLVFKGDSFEERQAEAFQRQRVLDMCAAPGGKTTLIADRASANTVVLAMDASARRIAQVARTSQLHRLSNISLLIADADKELPFAAESFDLVLLDAPCSGTGTLRHNPEIRWRLNSDDIRQLSEQQARFLANAAKVVKHGGLLVYSTCSLEAEENEVVIEGFLAEYRSFSQIPVPVNPRLLTPGGAARTWPHRDGTDGFYIAVLERL